MLIWTYILLGSVVQYLEGSSKQPDASLPCQGSGEPCMEFITHSSMCQSSDIQQAAAKRVWELTPEAEENDDFGDLYLWWIEEGVTSRLCCDIKVSLPIQIETLKMEWLYYRELENFGSSDYLVIQTDSNYNVLQELKKQRSRFIGHLEIKNASEAMAGAYACRVTAHTAAPDVVDGATALTIGRISEPFAITVYSDNLEFEATDYDKEIWLKDSVKKPYNTIDYKLRSINPRKELIVTVDTDDTLLQYIDIRQHYTMLISTFGDTDYESNFAKTFTVNIYYKGEEGNKLSRTWTIRGTYLEASIKPVIKVEFDDIDQSQEKFDKPFLYVVIGSCERFEYSAELDGSNLELNFDGRFSETFQEITSEKFTLNYRFSNSYSSGDLKNKNSYVELNLTRSDYAIVEGGYNGNTDLTITVRCSGSEITSDSIYFRGLPWFPTDLAKDRNCLDYGQTSPEGWQGLVSVGSASKGMCCFTQAESYPNTYLWHNGELLHKNNSKFEDIGKRWDVMLRALYYSDGMTEAEKLRLRYNFFEERAGYFQCFIGRYSYQLGSGPLQPRYPVVKSRTNKIGFDNPSFTKELKIDLTTARSFVPRRSDGDAKKERVERKPEKGGRDVTEYQIFVSERELVVVNGSCVELSATGVVFPHEKITWDTTTGKLYRDKSCTLDYDEETIENTSDNYASINPSFKYSYDPYDTVTIESKAYVGLVHDPKTTVYVNMGEGEQAIDFQTKLVAKVPFLNEPQLSDVSSGISNRITCVIEGYPIERANLTARLKKSGEIKILASFDMTEKDIDEDFKIELLNAVDNTMDTVECSAVNNLIQPPNNKRKAMKKIDLPVDSPDVTIIVVCVIGVSLLLLLIWIVCACIAMARNPQTKFGEAMCCSTGPYAKVEKIPMDPYKLEYFTLNPSVTLGGGHFGIVRRGFCTVLPDRSDERTEIAIKEVKPCIDRMRREDDLRRERDIMMRLRSHRNVLRIYGYTDEPDQLALVMEFAAFGSLDKLLVEARKIKSDGYLMPNEQIENPIQAFESQHIVDFGKQISDGMDYICRNEIVHRDLAARNIVVAGDDGEYILKITDFGLAREICDDGFYERVEGKEIPIKWTAPESLRGNIYTPKSDVWSYGITLWEICTLGGEPYAGYNNVETMEKLRSGYRLQKPPSCNTELYDLMRQCWLESPDDRPDFSHILTQLTNFSQKPSDYVHIDSLYETDLNLTLRLQTLQPPANNHHPSSSSSPPHSPEAV